jgi:glycosyltransferase involved in cell wall biosynthesis
MKVTIFSNFLNHHQIPICEEFFKMFKDDFKFVSCEEVDLERKKLGYESNFLNYPYLIQSNHSKFNFNKAIKLGLESDVVIIGSADEIFIEQRLIANKLTFRYSERLFKTNKHIFLYPYLLFKRFFTDTLNRNKNLFMLCSSAFTPLDYSLFFSYPNKFFKWGYFPEIKYYDIKLLIDEKWKKNVIEFLWVGRLISWKRPFVAVNTIQKLISKGINCHLTIIGDGSLFNDLKRYIVENKLSSIISLIGSIRHNEIRTFMENSHILLTTSTKQEGWGVVVNEAMNSGCVVYSHYLIGAAPYLIKHNFNGKLYTTNNNLIREIYSDLKDVESLKRISLNAYETIVKTWNPNVAVTRFVQLANSLLKDGKYDIPKTGPISKARIITPLNVKFHIRKYRVK